MDENGHQKVTIHDFYNFGVFIQPDNSVAISEKLPEEIHSVKIPDQAKISVVGVGMRNHPGVASRFFRCLDRLSISVHLVTTSEIKISAVVDGSNLEKAANAIHDEFSLDKDNG